MTPCFFDFLGEGRDEEPEWFSSGPISQNDTIELRGFDDADRLLPGVGGKKKMPPSQAKRARDWLSKKKTSGGGGGDLSGNAIDEKDEMMTVEGGPGGRSTPTPQAGDGAPPPPPENERKENKEKGQGDGAHNAEAKNVNDQSFFDDMFKSDSIPGLPGLLTVSFFGGNSGGKT